MTEAEATDGVFACVAAAVAACPPLASVERSPGTISGKEETLEPEEEDDEEEEEEEGGGRGRLGAGAFFAAVGTETAATAATLVAPPFPTATGRALFPDPPAAAEASAAASAAV